MKFTKTTTFTGRNGCFKATGLELSVYLKPNNDSVIVLEPITSRDIIGRCQIEIPREDIPALIAELQALNPVCKKCGSALVKGLCEDSTCPYSDHPQDKELEEIYEEKAEEHRRDEKRGLYGPDKGNAI